MNNIVILKSLFREYIPRRLKLCNNNNNNNSIILINCHGDGGRFLPRFGTRCLTLRNELLGTPLNYYYYYYYYYYY
jgi:hypothetical protein